MKIIHCADVHLDSPMRTHLSLEQARQRNIEITQTFVRMTEYAAKNDVQAVLIAGDWFDSKRVSKNTISYVLAAIQKTPKVQYYYLRGNHDEAADAFGGQSVPNNLRRFCDKWDTFSCGNCAISGIEITPDNAETLYNTVPHYEGAKNILVMHGQVGSTSGVDRVNLELLKNKGIDYLALGHLHEYQESALDRNGKYCYSGCLEGRGFDECGPKGFVLLEIDENSLKSTFIPFAHRCLHRVEVNISGMCDHACISSKIRKLAQDIDKEDLVEFVLTGRVNPESRVSPNYLLNVLKNDFYAVKIKNETKLDTSSMDYSKDFSLKGAYVRSILASSYSDEDKETLIRIGLDALRGEEVAL